MERRAKIRNSTILLVIFTLVAVVCNDVCADIITYWDFEDAVKPVEFTESGIIDNSGGYSSYGFGDNFLWSNGPHITLTLTDLPAHDSIDLNFLLASIDTWDGNTSAGGTVYPDYFNVAIDGTLIFRETFDFRLLSDQSYIAPSGGLLVHHSTSLYGTANEDAAYNMGIDTIFDDIVHTDSILTIEWWADGAGWQGTDPTIPYVDESFAIDNVEVIMNGVVPLPSTIILGILGLSTASWKLRKKSGRMITYPVYEDE